MSATPQALPPPAVGQSWLEHPLATEWHYYLGGQRSVDNLFADQIIGIANLMRRDWNLYNNIQIKDDR